MEMRPCILCIVELHLTMNNIKIVIFTQKCFNGEFISPATLLQWKCNYVFYVFLSCIWLWTI